MFIWDPVYEDCKRKSFENRGNARLRDFLGKARKHKKKPVWLGDAQWDKLQQYWANKAYKKLHEIAQNNRLGTPESSCLSLPTCGSIPKHEHRRRLVMNFAMYFLNFNTPAHFECGLIFVSHNSV